MTVYCVVPCYNEAAGLDALLTAIHETAPASWPWVVIVVDDGSDDGTAAILAAWEGRAGIRVIRHAQNQGLGRALLSGLRAAVNGADPDDAVVVMDGDLTHPPGMIAPMVSTLQAGHDIVVASRYAPGGTMTGVARYRHWLSRGASVALSLLFPTAGLQDYTSGFRAYRAGMLQAGLAAWGPALIEEVGFVCMAELVIKLSALGARIAEVPLELHYERKLSPSKLKVGRTIWRYLAMIVRLYTGPRLQAGGSVGAANVADRREL